MVDANGIPLATLLTAANVNDSVVLEHVLEAIPPMHHPHGDPRHRRVVERTGVWFNRSRRLRIRDERCAGIHAALIWLATALILLNYLPAQY